MKLLQSLRRFILPIVLVFALIGALVITSRPDPVRVDLAAVTRGPIQVTINEDGQTRVTDRYVVSSPIEGRMERVTLEAGDAITQGDTTLALIEPLQLSLLDARTRAASEARVRAAEAAVARTDADLIAGRSAQEFAQSELSRLIEAQAGYAANTRELDDARLAVVLRTQELRSAEFAQQIANFELEQARASLIESSPDSATREPFRIPAPITGAVLRVLRESEGPITPGTAILEIADTSRLEIQVDVLSQDAVRIEPGDSVSIERWGGDAPLQGRVRIVEPSGFTKISALGVEEQRVFVIIDFQDPDSIHGRVGDGYRVDARIVVDEAADAVLAPTGAVFPRDDAWATFIAVDGRAELRTIRIGLRNDRSVQILEGLEPGEQVIIYPSDRVADRVKLAVR